MGKANQSPGNFDRRIPGWAWLAFAWGLAESVFFFIVPDVFTSRLVLQKPSRGFAACAAAVAGALIGGTALFFAGRDPGTAARLFVMFDWIPGISPHLIGSSREAMSNQGLQSLFTGAASGIPYKLYAVHAGASGIAIGGFALMSAAARATRFGVVTGLAWAIGSLLRRRLGQTALLWTHAAAWILFYALYFRAMSG